MFQLMIRSITHLQLKSKVPRILSLQSHFRREKDLPFYSHSSVTVQFFSNKSKMPGEITTVEPQDNNLQVCKLSEHALIPTKGSYNILCH